MSMFNEFTFDLFASFANCFAVRNLWLTNSCFHVEFTFHTINDNVQMQLAHTGDNCLTRFFVCTYAERWIFSSQTVQCQAHFLLVSLCFWLNSLRNNWLWEYHAFQNNDCFFITQRVTSCCVFQTNHSSDITRHHFFDFFTLVRMHLHQTTDTFFFLFNRVINANAENFSVSSALRTTGSSSSFTPGTGGISNGDGRYSITASNIA